MVQEKLMEIKAFLNVHKHLLTFWICCIIKVKTKKWLNRREMIYTKFTHVCRLPQNIDRLESL